MRRSPAFSSGETSVAIMNGGFATVLFYWRDLFLQWVLRIGESGVRIHFAN